MRGYARGWPALRGYQTDIMIMYVFVNRALLDPDLEFARADRLDLKPSEPGASCGRHQQTGGHRNHFRVPLPGPSGPTSVYTPPWQSGRVPGRESGQW